MVDGARILVVAPDRKRSASGHAISIHQPAEVIEIRSDQKIKMFAAGGTPADCVKLVVEGILKRLDLIISGINSGQTWEQMCFIRGSSLSLRAPHGDKVKLQVSVGAFENVDYSLAADLCRLGLKMLSGQIILSLVNINVPAVPGESVAGIVTTRLGIQTYRDVFKKRVDPTVAAGSG